ncbi:hypothetical protein [Lysinibacillus sp. 54212]|uniref:hypothetical protein n=1 Tax=Lysinibacillus sp. 54212 TaxID=3119829 RepID=UPI002FC6D4FA
MNFHKLVLIGVVCIGIALIPDFIGLLIFARAFSKVDVPYAKLGMYCSILLSIYVFIEMFQVKNEGVFFYETGNIWEQIIYVAISLIYILNYACIFYVSNEIVKIEKSIFPKIFIGAQILFLLVTELWMHLPIDIVAEYYFITIIPIIVFYIALIVFLWKRKNMERALYTEMPSSYGDATS